MKSWESREILLEHLSTVHSFARVNIKYGCMDVYSMDDSSSSSLSFCHVLPPTIPTVIFVPSSFIKANMSGVISPRGMVSVPSTSKRARMRGFSGVVVVGGGGEVMILFLLL